MSGVPTDRCGYTWPEEDDSFAPADRNGGTMPHHASCCYREALPDDDRCAWHADPRNTEAKTIDALAAARAPAEIRARNEPYGELLDGAVLRGVSIGAELSLAATALRDVDGFDADLSNVSAQNANLSGAGLARADLSDTDLSGADLTGADLDRAILDGAAAHRADMTEVVARNVDASNAILSDASLIDADLRHAEFADTVLSGSDLTGADFRNAGLANAFISRTTVIGGLSRIQAEATEVHDWDELARAYGEVKSAYENNGIVGPSRRYHRLQRYARGLEARAVGGWAGNFVYLRSMLSRVTTGYGVSLVRLGAVMAGLFVVSSAVYFAAGIEHSVHYSIATFVGSSPAGDPPSRVWAEWVAMGETFAGTVLIVLLGYVLGNREQF